MRLEVLLAQKKLRVRRVGVEVTWESTRIPDTFSSRRRVLPCDPCSKIEV